MGNVEKLRSHILAYEDYMKKMGATLGTTVSHYNEAYKKFAMIDKDVVRISGGEVEIAAALLDKPKTE
jgi:DNA recombination protein RmuC